MKRCFKCKRIKELRFFYKHSKTSDGHLGKCKACTKRDVKKRWQNPEARERIRLYEKERQQDPKRRAKLTEYKKRSRAKLKGAYRAYKRIASAVRSGKITKKPCETCGVQKVEGHHTDYRKPLSVKWLCTKHHLEEHGRVSID